MRARPRSLPVLASGALGLHAHGPRMPDDLADPSAAGRRSWRGGAGRRHRGRSGLRGLHAGVARGRRRRRRRAVAGVGPLRGREASTGRALAGAGFIDAHVHVESSKLMVERVRARSWSRAGRRRRVPTRTSSPMCSARDGVALVPRRVEGLPLDVLAMAPSSCRRARFESPRAPLALADMAAHPARDRAPRPGRDDELPGRHRGDAGELAKLALDSGQRRWARAWRPARARRLPRRGHRADHEATTLAEALEKRRAGAWVLLREASNARNLRDLLPLVRASGPSAVRSAPTTASPTCCCARATSTRCAASRSPTGIAPRTRCCWRRCIRRSATA